MRLLEDVDLWVAAYAKSAPNPGSLTRGGAEGTIDGTSLRTLKALQLSVLDGRFQWGITHHPRSGSCMYLNRRVGRRPTRPTRTTPRRSQSAAHGQFQSSKIGSYKRPLRIVEVWAPAQRKRIILDAIFDPQFADQSHGFRPNRSQHSCVKYIRAASRSEAQCLVSGGSVGVVYRDI